MGRPFRIPPGVTEKELRTALSEALAVGQLDEPAIDYYLKVHHSEIYQPLEVDRPSARARYNLYARLLGRETETGSRVTRWIRAGARTGAEIERSRVGTLSKWRSVESEEPGPDPGRSWLLGPVGVVARWGSVVAVVLSVGALLFRFELRIAVVGLGFSFGFSSWVWASFLERRAQRDERPVGWRPVPPATGSLVTQIEYLRADGRIEVAELLRPAERP